MNCYDKEIAAVDLSPYRQGWCAVCGLPILLEKHHIVYKSHGGNNRHIIHLCQQCHRRVHNHTITFCALYGQLYVLLTICPVSIDFAMTVTEGWASMEELAEAYSARRYKD